MTTSINMIILVQNVSDEMIKNANEFIITEKNYFGIKNNYLNIRGKTK